MITQTQTTTLPAEHRPTKAALTATGGAVNAIVPRDVEQAYRLAQAVVAGRMNPKGMDSPEAVMIAIMHGMEVGMPPMAALQSIAVVNGRPTIWGDGAIGLVQGSGLLSDLTETFEGEGDNLTAICTAVRAGRTSPIVGRFSVADAKRAGLWDKAGPWKQYPRRMLQMRARGFCLRDGFADILRGLRLREEAQDDQGPDRARDVTPQAQDPVANLAAEIAQIEAQGEAVDTQTGETTETEAEELTSDASDSAPSGPEGPVEELGPDPLAAWRVEPPEGGADEAAWKRAYAAVSERIKAAQSPADAQAIEAANGEVIEAIEVHLKGWGKRLYAEIDKRKAA